MTDEVKVMLDEAKTKLATISSNETIVYSKFYRSQSEYLKCVGPPQDFYKAALMFLAYTPIESLPQAQKYMLATDMALASITGEDIFNFGEVIATPILNCLEGTPNEWLRILVFALNKGDIDGFNTIVDTYSKQYFAQPFLAAKHEFVKKKIVLLCLMNIVFELPSHERTIPFADIASRTRIPLDQVEWVLMRAMSLKMIKGTIDQVDQTVNVTWVQPRVLGKEQLGLLVTQLENWTDRVKGALVTMEDRTAELLA
jgi:26S proteasome regulatory subunit N9